MAFGDFATLRDDFNRSDANPLDGSWTNKVVAANANMKLASNQATPSASGPTVSSAWYTGATPAADCEAYVTCATVAGGTDRMRIYLRLATPGTAGVDGYFVQTDAAAGTDTWGIFRLDNASATSIASGSQEWSNGDKLGLSAIGSTISAYRYSGGSWSLLGSATDATYSAAGAAGIGGSGLGAPLFDDFYMGDVVTSTFFPKVMVF